MRLGGEEVSGGSWVEEAWERAEAVEEWADYREYGGTVEGRAVAVGERQLGVEEGDEAVELEGMGGVRWEEEAEAEGEDEVEEDKEDEEGE